jgi:hypothetical protein
MKEEKKLAKSKKEIKMGSSKPTILKHTYQLY